MATKIQLRHDSSNKWVEVNPILLPGEIGIELDTKKFKIGDGSTDWNNLQYAVSGSGGGSSVEVDGNTIILNTDGTISSNAVIDQNIGNAKTWTGTLAEYNLIKEKDAETLYYITDDIVEADTVITLDSDLNGLSEVGQAKFDVKANKDEVYTKEESYNKQEVDEAIQDATKNAGGGLEIGDIGIAPLGIDETKGKRRYLNGQLIIQEQYVQFTQKLKKAMELYPSLACTESEWQTTVTMTVGGQVGKFVVDDEAGTIRLPKIIMPIQGLTDLSKLAEIVEAGLPTHTHTRGTMNITGYVAGNNLTLEEGGQSGGALYFGGGSYVGPSNQGAYYGPSINLDASRNWTGSTSTGNYSKALATTNTVQQEQIQYPYFIQVATGAETEDNIINEIELNNPFSLLDYKYSEYELNNLSWLRSNGQYNSKAIYPAVYDLLLKIYNGTETKAGVSVKLSTETFTDYDFVLNTAEETFRLPIKTKQNYVVDEGKDEATGANYRIWSDGYCVQWARITGNRTGTVTLAKQYNSNTYYLNLSPSGGDNEGDYIPTITNKKSNSFVFYFDPGGNSVNTMTGYWKASGYLAQGQYTTTLYFYVGETVQNANLINAGRIEEKLVDKLDNNALNLTEEGKSLISGYGMPSSKVVTLTPGASGTTYTAPANGWVEAWGYKNTSNNLYINLTSSAATIGSYTPQNWGSASLILPVKKGSTFAVKEHNNIDEAHLIFKYAEGDK